MLGKWSNKALTLLLTNISHKYQIWRSWLPGKARVEDETEAHDLKRTKEALLVKYRFQAQQLLLRTSLATFRTCSKATWTYHKSKIFSNTPPITSEDSLPTPWINQREPASKTSICPSIPSPKGLPGKKLVAQIEIFEVKVAARSQYGKEVAKQEEIVRII